MTPEPTTFAGLVQLFLSLINPILVFLVAFALIVFFKGLIVFIAKSGDTASHKDGRNLMLWGIIALFLMYSVFGIMRWFYADLGFTRPFGLPHLPIR